MRRFIVPMLATTLFLLLHSAYGQCTDPLDATLCVYELTPGEAAQFSATDGQVTPFWQNWTGRDYIRMVPPDNCYPGRCGFRDTNDATITIRAAATELALYIYVAVQDEEWVEWPGGYSYHEDAVDLYFDSLSARGIWTCSDCLIGLYDSKLSFTSHQFQVFMGGPQPYEFKFQYYDPWQWPTGVLTFETAKLRYGFEGEIVQLDSTHRIQEWSHPWKGYCQGIAAGTVLAGKRFGFTAGYNDMDSGDLESDGLRWLGKDPWFGDQNYWGDLLLPADMPPVDTASMAVTNRGVRRSVAQGVAPEPYSLDGRRLVLGREAARGVTVRRMGTGGAILRAQLTSK